MRLRCFPSTTSSACCRSAEPNSTEQPPKGRHIAHLSDLLRVRVLRQYGGWWLDMDSIVLRPLPTQLPYYFATIPQKRSGGGCRDYATQALANVAKWAGHNIDYPAWDGGDHFQNTPIYIATPNDPLSVEWERRLAPLVLGASSLPWLGLLREMEAVIPVAERRHTDARCTRRDEESVWHHAPFAEQHA